LLGLAACGGAGSGLVPNDASRHTQGTPQALPGGTPQALPGGTPQALPGGTPQALPGASLACNLTFQEDQANCTVAINTNVAPVSDATTPANLLPGLHPQDLRAAYALPSQNNGNTVAIVDAYDDPNAEADLAVYRSAFGLSSCTSTNGCFRKVNQSGQSSTYPAPDAGWSMEIALDVDMVSAVCPNCTILLVEANSNSLDDLGAAVDTAAALGAKEISNSYYGPEWSGETAEDGHYNHAGVAITVSAGDQVSPFYPAASPYVTSVGGTTISNGTESAWQYGAQGCSAYESRPKYQNGNTGCKTRSIVDVAAVADPQTGVSMYDSSAGGWLVAGGTSVGAPIVAAAYALSGNPQGPAYSYSNPGAFHDVPPSGYDLATGLGSPNGVSGL
jgi:subtilase family serine protease